jgi:hypothetical protein
MRLGYMPIPALLAGLCIAGSAEAQRQYQAQLPLAWTFECPAGQTCPVVCSVHGQPVISAPDASGIEIRLYSVTQNAVVQMAIMRPRGVGQPDRATATGPDLHCSMARMVLR